MNSIGRILFGIVCIILGITVIAHPTFYHRIYQRIIDVSAFHIPLGLSFIICGAIFLYVEINNK